RTLPHRRRRTPAPAPPCRTRRRRRVHPAGPPRPRTPRCAAPAPPGDRPARRASGSGAGRFRRFAPIARKVVASSRYLPDPKVALRGAFAAVTKGTAPRPGHRSTFGTYLWPGSPHEGSPARSGRMSRVDSVESDLLEAARRDDEGAFDRL